MLVTPTELRSTEARQPPTAVIGGIAVPAWRLIMLAAGLVVIAVIPFVLKNFFIFQITLAIIYAIAILGLNLLTGFNGQFSLGHSAFYAIGAYTAAIMMENMGIGYVWTIPVAAVVCFVFGFLFGLPALRLEGIYLALATFALAIAIPQVLKSSVLEHWTGGVQGIVIIKPDAPFGLPLSSDQWLYLFTVAVAIVMYVCATNLVKSRTGRALIAIRDHPVAASAMGINVSLYKSLTFGVSALYTGVAGALGAIAIGFVAPDSFTFVLAVALFVGLVVGGVASIPGTLVGGLFVLFVPNIAESVSKGLAGAVYGVILLLVIYLMPTGAAGLARWMTAQIAPTGPLPNDLDDKEEAMRSGKRALIASVALCLALAGPAVAQKKYDHRRERQRNQDRQRHSLQRAGVRLRHDRPDARRLLQEGQRRGRHQRPQDHLHHLRRRLRAAEDGRADAQAGRKRRSAADVQQLGTAHNTAIQSYLNGKKVPQLFVATGATKFGDPKNFPWTMGWQPNYQSEGARLRQISSEKPSERKDRRSFIRTTTTARTT